MSRPKVRIGRMQCVEPGCFRLSRTGRGHCSQHSVLTNRGIPEERRKYLMGADSIRQAKEADARRYARGEPCRDCHAVCANPAECARIINLQTIAERVERGMANSGGV